MKGDQETQGEEGTDRMVSLAHVSMVTLKVASCFYFSFVCSTGGKGHALQTVIPKAVAVVLLFPIVPDHLTEEL